MRLIELLEGTNGEMQAPAFRQDLEITGLTADSRMVEPGFLFAAFPGSATDGRIFIPQAIERGAVAVLAPEGSALPDSQGQEVALITNASIIFGNRSFIACPSCNRLSTRTH